jgi:L-ribulose-5-phosphate 3-epimerase UlaE
VNLGELRGWVEANRIVLREEELESVADFVVKMLVQDRFKGRPYTAEDVALKVVEFSIRRSMEAAAGSEREREFRDKMLMKAINFAKKLGVTTEEIAGATLRATRPLQ